MSGERPFDDDRWPDQEGFACCFMCGKRVDPRDPSRGSYTINAKACEPIPCHLDCVFGQDMMRVQVAFMAAINEMTDVQIKRARELAQVAVQSPLGN
jgi:hypothetical protein